MGFTTIQIVFTICNWIWDPISAHTTCWTWQKISLMIAVVDHRAFDKAITPALVAITVINLLKIKTCDLDHTIDGDSHFLQDSILNCHRKTASKIQGACTNICNAFSLWLLLLLYINIFKIATKLLFWYPIQLFSQRTLVSDPEWKSCSKYCIPFRRFHCHKQSMEVWK